VCRCVRLGSSSWALVRLWIWPLTHGDAWKDGKLCEIRTKSGISVAECGRWVKPRLAAGSVGQIRGHCGIVSGWAALDAASYPVWFRGLPVEPTHPSPICHSAAANQGRFSGGAGIRDASCEILAASQAVVDSRGDITGRVALLIRFDIVAWLQDAGIAGVVGGDSSWSGWTLG
jgi:hypothetical protein